MNKMTGSMEVSQPDSPQTLLSSPSGPMNMVAVVLGAEVRHGSETQITTHGSRSS